MPRAACYDLASRVWQLLALGRPSHHSNLFPEILNDAARTITKLDAPVAPP